MTTIMASSTHVSSVPNMAAPPLPWPPSVTLDLQINTGDDYVDLLLPQRRAFPGG